MGTQRISGHMALLALLVGFAGFTLFVIVETMGGPLDDAINIDRPVVKVFRALVAPENIGVLSQNIGQVQLPTNSPLAAGSSYKRILYSHGLPNFQVVTVEGFEQDRYLETKTWLVGFDVTYRYTLTPMPDGKTLLSLQKEGLGGWPILEPLLIHLLTRPEHDGDHLARIKRFVEAAP